MNNPNPTTITLPDGSICELAPGAWESIGELLQRTAAEDRQAQARLDKELAQFRPDTFMEERSADAA